MGRPGLAVWALAVGLALSAPAQAAQCGNTADGFQRWLDDFKQVAINDGVSPEVVDQALGGAHFEPSVLKHDQGQASWQGGSFEAFAASHITPSRLKRGRQMMLAYAEPLDRIEQTYGVPGAAVVAIWGLETDYGAVKGQYPTFNALATLAYDCRRGSLYRAELVDALMIVERGLLTPDQMRGAWAGELGQTQFMPSAYLKYGVDAHGGRGGDLMRNSADALASTANFLRAHGWQRGAGWNPGQPNFAAILEWNSAEVYAKTIAEFANKLAGP